jgi:hypothetical protein
VHRNYNLLGQDSKFHKIQPDEVRKEYIYRGRKIVRYYKVKNGPISGKIEQNIPGSRETESIQQITSEQKVAET